MKTCKNFCDNRVKQQRKVSTKSIKKIKTRLKQLRKKVETISGKKKINILEYIKTMEGFLKTDKNESKKIEKVRRDTCNKIYCNPGCKEMMFDNNSLDNDFYRELPKNYVKKIQREGAISGCIKSKPLL